MAAKVHAVDASALRWVGGALSLGVTIVVSVIVPREAMKRLEASSVTSRPTQASYLTNKHFEEENEPA